MSKGKIGCVGVLVSILGLLVWGYLSLGIIVPIDRIVLIETPGGSIPMRLVVFEKDDAYIIPGGPRGQAGIMSAKDGAFRITQLKRQKGLVELSFDSFDSVLRLEGDFFPRGSTGIHGTWSKNRGERGTAELDVTVPQVMTKSWYEEMPKRKSRAYFNGRWSVDFESSVDLAIGEFYVWSQKDDIHTGLVQGTFMTTTGDYRFLAGRVDGNLMRLSTFDGAHAFLFHARMKDDGTIEGDFWSGNWHHETWTATRDDDASLPDAFGQTVIADEDALDDMVFKNLQGEPTRVLDVLDASNAKARIIEIFGTWCPNCSDAGRELVSLREQYGDDLAVVGLAFEIVDDFDRSVQQVTRHHEHIGTDWPILIAGLSDKEKASVALPVLDKVRSYPTLIFLDRNNEVRGVYSGFSGPATGDAYTQQRERFEALIESMLD